MMFRYSDEEILEGLRQRNNYFIIFVYNNFGPAVRHFVRQNSGNDQDVEDIIHDTLLILFIRVRLPTFRLNCSLKTYFIAVARNLWLQRLERKCRLMYQADWEVSEPGVVYSPEENELKETTLEQYRLFFKHLEKLPTECRRLLELYILKIPYKEIARLMKYKDEIYVKTRKYSCKNLLRKKILNDPEYRLFSENDGESDYKQLDRSL